MALITPFASAAAGAVNGTVAALAKGVMRAMFLTRLKAAALAILTVAVVGAGAGVLARGGQKGSPRPERPADEAAATDREAIRSLERRITELERKLDAVLNAKQGPGARGPEFTEPEPLRKIRPRFECLVEAIHVKLGQAVKKGEPLAELLSAELAQAKSDLQNRWVQWQHELRLYNLRKKLVANKAIAQEEWAIAQMGEQTSRLDFDRAHDKLSVFYEVPQDEIDATLNGLLEDQRRAVPPGPKAAVEAIQQERDPAGRKARFTLRSPVDGTVTAVNVEPQDLADPKTVLMVIRKAK
jgi:multidrug efflux pump subunit AcrA (membrane-fusion protein)